MDKLVPVIEFFKKYGFWILCFIMAGASVGVWFYASGEVDKLNADLTRKIEGSFQTGNNLRSTSGEPDVDTVSAHPNTASEEGMNEKISAVEASVVSAWKKRYDAQQSLMEWPEEVSSKSATFVDAFKKFNPPETFPADNTGDKMVSLLKIYKQNIPYVMDRICKIIGTEWVYEEEEAVAANAGNGEGDRGEGRDGDQGDRDGNRKKAKAIEEIRVICEWNEDNQEVWNSKLTEFESRDDNELPDNVPTPSQIYMLQQDLWLLEAMFNVIRNVNSRDGAGQDMVKANDLATVKRIDHIAFGREALAKLGSVTEIVPESSSTRQGGGMGREGRPSSPVARGKKAEDNGFGEIDFYQKPAYHARYIKADMSDFLKAEDIQKAVSPTAPLPAGDNLGLLVAKRVPVRLAVKIDETKIPEFVSACENAPFPFKVWQVRINKHEANQGIVHMGGGGGHSKKKKKKKRELGAAGFGGADQEATGSASALEFGPVETRTTYDVKAEFIGYITIYNPVDEARLTGKKPDAGTEETTKPNP